MADSSADILERFDARPYPRRDGKIALSLQPTLDLLANLGDPHKKLPPVFHVAGTNGKGSTCAFLRAMLEAAGYRVHVYTSPHLVRFHERIRIAGELISEPELAELLAEMERNLPPGGVSYFEAATAAAFAAFARHPADFVILETGLGGRLDATNVVDKPLAAIITRLSYDHRGFLGDTIEKIAREKAGIMKRGVPCFTAAQPDAPALRTLRDAAAAIGAPLSVGGEDWHVAETAGGFRFSSGAARDLDLPRPALLGQHQYQNAGLAIAALAALPRPLPAAAVARGMQTVEWKARLQRLKDGKLAALLPAGAELWLDGGHNDSAGEALAAQIERWRGEDGGKPKPFYIVMGMLTTKNPREFLAPMAKSVAQLHAVAIPGEPLSFTAAGLAGEGRKLGIEAIETQSVAAAIKDLAARNRTGGAARILICGSLYLAGAVLAENESESAAERR